MHEFDLEKAKQGAKVCTRDGRPVRIVCFDRKGGLLPIIALIKKQEKEEIYGYENNGKNPKYKDNLDLMMASEKKEGWTNLYCSFSDGCSRPFGHIYNTKEEAEASAQGDPDYIKTIKIE